MPKIMTQSLCAYIGLFLTHHTINRFKLGFRKLTKKKREKYVIKSESFVKCIGIMLQLE